MRFSAGTEVVGDAVALPISYVETAESTVGAIYEVRGKCKVIDDSKVSKYNLIRVSEELYNRFGAKLRYIEVNDDFVRVQVEGSPFALGAFLLALPEILKIIGILLVAASVILIIPKAQWEVFLLIVGLFLALGGIGKVLDLSKIGKLSEEIV